VERKVASSNQNNAAIAAINNNTDEPLITGLLEVKLDMNKIATAIILNQILT